MLIPPIEPGDSVPSLNNLGSGRRIEESALQPFESHFGVQLPDVWIHTGPRAEAAAWSMHARAYTVGRHVVFGAGQFAPGTAAGRWLIAHELTHIVQQGLGGAARPQRAPETPGAALATPATDTLQGDLQTWANAQQPPVTLDPNSEDYALALHMYCAQLLHIGDALIEKPKVTAAVPAWEQKFEAAYQIALLILAARGGEERAAWAGQIGQDLATRGFVAEALDLANRLPAGKQRFILENLLDQHALLTVEQVSQFSEFVATTVPDLADNLFLKKLAGDQGQFANAMGSAKLAAALRPTLRYKSDPAYVNMLTEVLVYCRSCRVEVSDWLWSADKEFLFSILNSPTFKDPDYRDSLPPGSKAAAPLTMADDMPWVYTYKQKYYVDHLIELAAKSLIQVDPPADLKFESVRNWLDAHTGDFGRALALQYADQPQRIAETYDQIADIFFFHVDEPRQVRLSNPSGRISGLQPGSPAQLRMEADCDVLATYCMRLITGSGFVPVAYLGIAPTHDDGHVAAMLKHDKTYYVVSNLHMVAVTVPDDQSAPKALLAQALDVYTGSTPTSRYRVYFDAALPDGSMSGAFLQDILSYEDDKIAPASERTRAKALESNGPP